MRISTTDWFLLALLSLLWGGGFFLVAIAIREVHPLVVVFCRVLIAAILLSFVLIFSGESLPRAGGTFLCMGLLNNAVPFSLLFWAQSQIPSGIASVLNATTPLFSLLVAHYCLSDEPINRGKLAGICFGFVGVIVLVAETAGFERPDVAMLAMLACLGAAFSFSLAGIYGRRFKALGISHRSGAFGQLAASTLLMLPMVFISQNPGSMSWPSSEAVISIMLLGIASTAFAYLLFFRLLASIGAVNVSLVTLLMPVSAILLGTQFLGEVLTPGHGFGIALVAVGLLIIDGRILQWLRRPSIR